MQLAITYKASMIRSLYTAATGMEAQQTNIDVLSHNLANLNTAGFKKSKARFNTLFSQTVELPGARQSDGRITPNGIQVGLGVELGSTQKSFEVGSLVNSGNDLDIAIEGDGFLQVEMPDGSVAYTRSGNLQVDGESGELVTSQGYSLFPNINLGSDIGKVEISREGIITVIKGADFKQADEVGNFRLIRFVNPAGLADIGNNLFKETLASGSPFEGDPNSQGFGAVRQRFLEQSNVKVVEEIVDMITAQRAYEANSNVIRASDEMMQQANNLAA